MEIMFCQSSHFKRIDIFYSVGIKGVYLANQDLYVKLYCKKILPFSFFTIFSAMFTKLVNKL